MTPWQKHVAKWRGCTACSSCQRRRNVVMYRGSIPCDVMFVGEAPGSSEDVIGQPFVGQAGKLLDEIIRRAVEGEFRIGLTNLVACIPLDENSSKFGEPPEESIKACADRLRETVVIARPKLLVTVGKLAEKWVPKMLKPPVKSVTITHPAAILRSDEAGRGLLIKRAVVTIRDAVEDLI